MHFFFTIYRFYFFIYLFLFGYKLTVTKSAAVLFFFFFGEVSCSALYSQEVTSYNFYNHEFIKNFYNHEVNLKWCCGGKIVIHQKSRVKLLTYLTH